jgi:hypothetical protein
MINSQTKKALCASIIPFTLIGCIEKETVEFVPNAENIFFTDSNQLLVTGGQNIYEITAEGDGYKKKALFNGEGNVGKLDCQFTGIAQQGDWVFTSCVSTKFLIFKNNHLLAAKLDGSELEFRLVTNSYDLRDPYDKLALPNGLAFAPDGSLLVADYNMFGASGVARIDIDYSGDFPEIANLEKNFVSPDVHGISSPNGIRVEGDYLYMSDANSVKRFKFDALGESVGQGAEIWSGALAIVDDIMPYCNGVAFTSYLSGRLHYATSHIDENGVEHFPVIYSTPPFAFDSPSSLAYGSIPGMFDTSELLVTEKGLLTDMTSGLGNRLSVSPLTMDLADANACNVIADLAREAVEGS